MVTKVVEFEKQPHLLVIRLTEEGRKEADEILGARERYGTDRALVEVCEHQLCNGWELLGDDDKIAMGALTGCEFIITDEAERDDHGTLVKIGAVYWNPNYAIEDEIEVLLAKGEIRLIKVVD